MTIEHERRGPSPGRLDRLGMAALIALEGTSFLRRAINMVGLNAAQHHQCAAFRTVWQLGLFHHRHRELIYAARPSRLSAGSLKREAWKSAQNAVIFDGLGRLPGRD